MAACAVMTCAWLAGAQPAGPVIEAPRPEQVAQPAYPKGGHGDAKVVLLLVISQDGTVEAAEVLQGSEPFAGAARRAAQHWTFSPATKNGTPVMVKIRFEVAFEETKVPTSEATTKSRSEPAAADEPLPAGVIDVVVEGVKHPPSVTSLRASEVRQLPGAFGDPFRAIEIMPGVTPIVSGLPFFYVRGAPPGNIGYYLDGIRVPYLFHVAAGPSVVHPGIVERVDLYSGGYPAKHGRYAGAIVSAEANEPNPEWHGEGVLRLVDAGALVEGGFGDGRATALLAGRYSYTGGLLSLISPEITLDYRDFQTRVSYDVTDDDRISLFSFGAYDYLSSTQNDIETVLFGTEFYRIDARYDARLSGGGKIRAAVTWGYDQTQVFGRNTQDQLIGSRVELERPLDDDLTLRAGVNLQHDNYSADEPKYIDPEDPLADALRDLFPPRQEAAASAWFDLKLRMNELEIIPGVRLDTYYSGGTKAAAADPRLATIVHLHDHLRVLTALGLASQPPAFVVPVPGLEVANLSGGLQRSLQTSAGVQVDLPWQTTASVTVFDSMFFNMTDSIGSGDNDGGQDTLIPRSDGNAKGVEVYLHRSLSKRVGGFIAYTFSRSTRTIGALTFPAAFDRTHVFHSAVGVDLGRGWRNGVRFTLYSGAPDNSVEIDANDPQGDPRDPSDPPRDPVFYRLDFRVEKKWRVRESGWISVVLEMINATLNPEVISGGEVGPILIPSIGLEGGF